MAVDGVFGEHTKSAVVHFQNGRRLIADGWEWESGSGGLCQGGLIINYRMSGWIGWSGDWMAGSGNAERERKMLRMKEWLEMGIS